MKQLGKMICVGLMSLPLIFGGCGSPKEYMKLQGIVFSERYMPESRGLGTTPSRYSFSIDTELGRKAIQVESTRIEKESIDALIEPGTKVEVEVEKDKVGQQTYEVLADKIKVLE